jgi:hypothetical protein
MKLCIWQWNYHTIFKAKYFYCFQMFHSVSSRNLFALIPSSHLCSLAWLISRPHKQGMGRKRQNCCEKWGILKQNHCMEWSRLYLIFLQVIDSIYLALCSIFIHVWTKPWCECQEHKLQYICGFSQCIKHAPGSRTTRFLEYVVCYPCLSVHNIWSNSISFRFKYKKSLVKQSILFQDVFPKLRDLKLSLINLERLWQGPCSRYAFFLSKFNKLNCRCLW